MQVFWVGSTDGHVQEVFKSHAWKQIEDLAQLKRNFQRLQRDEKALIAVNLETLSQHQASMFLKLRKAFPNLRLAVFASQIEALADLELHKDSSILLIPRSEAKPKELYQAWLAKGRVVNRRSLRQRLNQEKSLGQIESEFSGLKQQVQFVDFSNQGALVMSTEAKLNFLDKASERSDAAKFAAKEFVVFEYKDKDAKVIRVKSQIRWSQRLSANQYTYGLQFIGVL